MIGLYQRISFLLTEKRIGLDMPFPNWMLQFPSPGYWLAKRKLAWLGDDSFLCPDCCLVRTDWIGIGSNVVIRPKTVQKASDIALLLNGDSLLIGSCAHFYSALHRFNLRDVPISELGHSPVEDPIIEDNVGIGANVISLASVRSGKNSVIAAGSPVTKSVEPLSLYAGVPAHKIRGL